MLPIAFSIVTPNAIPILFFSPIELYLPSRKSIREFEFWFEALRVSWPPASHIDIASNLLGEKL